MGKSVIKHGECEYTLSETSQNLIENLAAHLAERNSGVITVNHLAPHLPVSLRLLRDALDAMVDGRAVLYDETSLFPEYHFSAFLEKDPEPGAPADRSAWSRSRMHLCSSLHECCPYRHMRIQ
mgnify:CR=1 FL=1